MFEVPEITAGQQCHNEYLVVDSIGSYVQWQLRWNPHGEALTDRRIMLLWTGRVRVEGFSPNFLSYEEEVDVRVARWLVGEARGPAAGFHDREALVAAWRNVLRWDFQMVPIDVMRGAFLPPIVVPDSYGAALRKALVRFRVPLGGFGMPPPILPIGERDVDVAAREGRMELEDILRVLIVEEPLPLPPVPVVEEPLPVPALSIAERFGRVRALLGLQVRLPPVLEKYLAVEEELPRMPTDIRLFPCPVPTVMMRPPVPVPAVMMRPPAPRPRDAASARPRQSVGSVNPPRLGSVTRPGAYFLEDGDDMAEDSHSCEGYQAVTDSVFNVWYIPEDDEPL